MSREKILIVDDDAVYRRLLRQILSTEGYEITEAKDGREAMECIGRGAPDLILLDLIMPRPDGYEVCRRIKEDPQLRLIPIIVVSSLEWLPAKVLALQHTASDFLNKTAGAVELVARVKSHLAIKQFTDELENAGVVLEGIARVVDRRDAYTSGHGLRVSLNAAKLGKALGLGDPEIEALVVGARLHDLGKIAIDDKILRKAGSLDPGELAAMKAHPVIGEELIKPMRTLEKIRPLVRSHHERLDGSGYPDGLPAARIPLSVRILSVADIYDALTTTRSYRRAHSSEEAIGLLRSEADKGWWDCDVVDAWARLMAIEEVSPGLSR